MNVRDLILAALLLAAACAKHEDQPAPRPTATGSATGSASAPAPDAQVEMAAPDQGKVPPLPAVTSWELDPENSSVTFVCKHANHTNVRGMFQRPSGTVLLDDAHPARSKINATIDLKLITTGVDERDTHLKSPEFFDVIKFPVATFVSTSVSKTGDGAYSVVGNLTIREITKPVTLAVTASPPFQHFGSIRRGIEATTSISRQAFGVGAAEWNVPAESGGLLIGDTVALTIDAELVLQGDGERPKPQ